MHKGGKIKVQRTCSPCAMVHGISLEDQEEVHRRSQLPNSKLKTSRT